MDECRSSGSRDSMELARCRTIEIRKKSKGLPHAPVGSVVASWPSSLLLVGVLPPSVKKRRSHSSFASWQNHEWARLACPGTNKSLVLRS
jgi:hypothetical protein